MARPFRVGPWQADPATNRLGRRGESVRIEPKVMDLLVALSARAGEVVSREELLASVWQGAFVSDHVLTTAVYQLRRALGDDARAPRFVEAVPKRGYRLVAAVGPADESRPAGTPPASDRPRPARPVARRGTALAAALALAALGLARVDGPPGATGGSPAGLYPGAGVPRAEAAVRAGWQLLDRTGPEAASRALDLFERAAALDPADPLARSGLAEALVRARLLGLRTGPEVLDRARAAAEAGVALDPERAAGHRALALALLAEWDFAGAEASLDRARALAPDDPRVLALLAQVHFVAGRREAALAAMERARTLAPASPSIQTLAGHLAAALGSPGLAGRAYARALVLDPGAEEPARGLAKLRSAAADAQEAPPLDAREVLARLTPKLAEGPVPPSHVASLYAEIGAEAEALEWLDRAFRSRDPGVFFLRYDSRWEPFRDHPRVRSLLARLGRPGGPAPRTSHSAS